MYPWLAWYWICRPGWSRTRRDVCLCLQPAGIYIFCMSGALLIPCCLLSDIMYFISSPFPFSSSFFSVHLGSGELVIFPPPFSVTPFLSFQYPPFLGSDCGHPWQGWVCQGYQVSLWLSLLGCTLWARRQGGGEVSTSARAGCPLNLAPDLDQRVPILDFCLLPV